MKTQWIMLITALQVLFNILYAQNSLPKIFINEFMASNSRTILSPGFNEYADWLEIYNAGDETVDISGFYLTDDFGEPQKWQIPAATVINPGHYILFWADGNDQGLHTNFRLSADGEHLGLFSAGGQVIDTIGFSQQLTDISFGRYPDGSGDWFFFEQPSPAEANIYPGFEGRAADPEFSVKGGFYQGPLSVAILAGHPNDTIRYTMDGSLPDRQSPVYLKAVELYTTSVIRARAFRQNYLPGTAVTRTYFIDEITTLPVVSIATDPANLWDEQSGIYVAGSNGIPGYCSDEPRNWNQPWEVPVSLELFEATGDPAFEINAGMQIGGGCTRLYPQKSLAIYTRPQYGVSKINYRFFDDKAVRQFNNILLRNSGQDWWRAMFRDGMMHTLVKDRMDIDWLAYKPVVLFLNGDYWGIHAIREKHNEHYLAANYDINPDEIDILSQDAVVNQGSADQYEAMIDFITVNDMSAAENYNWVATQMDINEYLNYVIAEIFFANIDWPGGNIKYWRQQGENNKWRWILFDTDLGFGAHGRGQYDSNTLANATSPTQTYYANPPWSTLLLRKLLQSDAFKNQFIQRFAAHLNTTFSPRRVLTIIDSLKTRIETEIPRHIQKWPQSTSFNEGWNYHIDVMREFALKRPGYIIDHLATQFGLSGSVPLYLDYDDNMGTVFINGVAMPADNFRAVFLKGIPVQCKAVARHGYRFAGWQGLSGSESDTLNVVLNKTGSLQALFEADPSEVFSGLRINEILTLNEQTIADDWNEYDDWIELYNDSPQAIDIGGIYITDNLSQPDMYRIPSSSPDSTIIPPGSFLLLWADNDPGQGIRHVGLRLSGDGEQLGLFRKSDSAFVLIDSLVFGSQTADVSWGRLPDGGEEFSFFMIPTPASQNIVTGIADTDFKSPLQTSLDANYPNPFNATTNISYRLKTAAHVKLTVYDIAGRVIQTLVNRPQSAGQYNVSFDATGLPSGIYTCHLKSGDFQQGRKMILLK